jgi:hypothetical protein
MWPAFVLNLNDVMEDYLMKPIYILLLVVFILLTACQSATPEPTPQVVEQVEQPVEEGYPPPEQMPLEDPNPDPESPQVSDDPYPYLESPPVSNEPYPALQVPMVSNDPYAAPVEQPASISWEEARTLVMEGQVVKVAQSHSLDVIIYLEDGRVVSTVEPEIDAVFVLLDECGEICKDVIRTIE